MLDDEAASDAPAELYAEQIKAAARGELEIIVRRPGRMGDTVAMIGREKPDGLLLDVALTNALDDDRQPVGFDGIALAQQVRTLQTRARTLGADRSLPEFPIIRLSKKDVIREYVSEDSTSDDLFDELVDKELVIDDPAVAAAIAFSLARDYPAVSRYADGDQSDTSAAALLGLAEETIARLDARTLLGLRRPGAPAHILAHFVIAKLLDRPGPLIDGDLLAVRLGVDPEASPDWPALRVGLDDCRYKGAFAGGYQRWWMMAVNDWWQREIDDVRPAARLQADDRIELLRRKTSFAGLSAIVATADNPGSRFWHRCVVSGLPVDAAEGFPLLPIYGHEIWHDPEYICQEEALLNPRNARLSPIERARAISIITKRAVQ